MSDDGCKKRTAVRPKMPVYLGSTLVCAFVFLLKTSESVAQVLVPIIIPSEPLPECPAPNAAQLDAAIADAGKTVGKFIKSYKESNFFTRGDYQALVSTDARSAFAWVRITGAIDDSFSGTIVQLNDPNAVSKWKLGDKLEGKVAGIYDWSYKGFSKTYGDYILRSRVSNCIKVNRDKWYSKIFESEIVPASW